MRTGSYNRLYGLSHVRNSGGYWWSNTDTSTRNSYYLYTYSDINESNVDSKASAVRGNGYAIRCTIRVE